MFLRNCEENYQRSKLKCVRKCHLYLIVDNTKKKCCLRYVHKEVFELLRVFLLVSTKISTSSNL